MKHDDWHADRLEQLAAGAGDLREAFAGSEIAGCDACAARVEEHLTLVGELARAGREQRADLESARTTSPYDGAAETALRRELGLAGSGRSPLAWPRLAVAAVLILGAVLGVRFLSSDAPGDPTLPGGETWLGERPEPLAPKGEVEAFDLFSWRAELPENGWFRVVVHNGEGGERDGEVVARSPRLEEPRWKPAPEENGRWPDRIRWRLEVYRGTGAGDLVDSAFASAVRSR